MAHFRFMHNIVTVDITANISNLPFSLIMNAKAQVCFKVMLSQALFTWHMLHNVSDKVQLQYEALLFYWFFFFFFFKHYFLKRAPKNQIRDYLLLWMVPHRQPKDLYFPRTFLPLIQRIISPAYFRIVSKKCCCYHKDFTVLIPGVLFTIAS